MAFSRATCLPVGAKALRLPAYFPSISSVKTALRPHEYLNVLSPLIGLNRQFLVSAFDLSAVGEPERVQSQIEAARAAGAITLMDSGNYESFWKDAQAAWPQGAFHKTLRAFPCDLAFCFDDQEPPEDADTHVAQVVRGWREDQNAAGPCMVVPIVHGSPQALPALCARVALETGATLLAVAERRLGEGVTERATAVRAIREELDRLGRFVALHLLGTGNPISIALYAAMGADSFDGLEWCQTVVDHDTALLHHLSQADFFAGQTAWVDDASLSFQARTLAHNLEFYSSWMSRLQDATLSGNLVGFCRHNFPGRVFGHCSAAFGWELQ